MNKIIWILVTLIAITWVIIGSLCVNTNKQKQLTVLPYKHKSYVFDVFECDMSKCEIKNKLDDVYDIRYEYAEQPYLGENIDGIATPNKIIVRDDLDTEQYIIVLSHELTHLKYNTNNETFTEYTSLVTLYESGENAFKVAALNKARFIVAGGYKGSDLDCGYYLLNYFGGKL